MAEQVSEQVWTWVGTPNPAEKIFAIYIPTELINPIDLPERPSNMPKRESVLGVNPYTLPTKFKDLDPAFNVAHLCSMGVADWYFIGESIGPKTSVFYFFKNKTTAEENVPYHVEEKHGDHPWDMVLHDAWIESDYNFPISTNSPDGGIITGPTNYIRDIIDPAVENGSLFVTQKFLTATRPKFVRHKVPIPTSVHIQVNGASREYPRVLMDDLSIDASRSGTQKSLNGTTEAVGGSIAGLFYPKTNFTQRKAFILLHEPVMNQYGLWETTKVIVHPPKLLPPTLR